MHATQSVDRELGQLLATTTSHAAIAELQCETVGSDGSDSDDGSDDDDDKRKYWFCNKECRRYYRREDMKDPLAHTCYEYRCSRCMVLAHPTDHKCYVPARIILKHDANRPEK